MKITMVKKRLASGEACNKCAQAEEMLKSRGLWQLIDHVAWADESNPESEGLELARRHGVELAPFFVVEQNGGTAVYDSVIAFAKAVKSTPEIERKSQSEPLSYQLPESRLAKVPPRDVIKHALTAFGASCGIAFSGAEDVVLIDMALKTGLPFSVFCIDTGRLHPETYRFLDNVRRHYDIEIHVVTPEPLPVEALVRKKGLYSFYDDGHQECCEVRKVSSLRRVLENYRAWMTGQRRDQSPTRSELEVVAWDTLFGQTPGKLCKFNPLAEWSLSETWDYIRANSVPTNALHERGYISIGCEPCTRAIRPGEHERAGRWWWEEATQRECGLHVPHRSPRGAGI
jgi:phosphoadenosine phosphosulfate reductase